MRGRRMGRKIIGIMGGMGPESTIDLYAKIFHESCKLGADRDQDHPEVVISSIPQTPDRTASIFGDGESPVPELVRSAARLQKAGADFIVIACNSAHHFLPEIRSGVTIPVFDIMELTAAHIKDRYPGVRHVGILATDGTIASKLYHRALAKVGLKPIVPKENLQKDVMEAIYGSGGVKSGVVSRNSASKIKSAADGLISDGAEILIAGCTEIPIGLDASKVSAPLVDATEVLASAAVEAAFGVGNRD